MTREPTERLQAEVEAGSTDPELNYELAARLVASGEGERATRLIHHAASSVPDATDRKSARLLGMAAYLEAQHGSEQQAAVLLDRAAKSDPAGIYPGLARGILEQRAGRQDAAIAEFTRLTKTHPEDAEAWTRLGTALLSKGVPDEAERPLRQAAHLRPNLAASHVDLGEALGQMRHFSEAAKEFDAACKLDPVSLDFRLMHATALASAARTESEFDAARTELSSVLTQSSNNVDVQLLLAGLLLRFCRYDDAITALKSVVAQSDRNRDAWFNLAWAYERIGDLANAGACRQQFDRIISTELKLVKARRQVNRNPNSGALRVRLSKILHGARLDREAYAELVKAAELSKNDPEIARVLASARASMERSAGGQPDAGSSGVGR